MSELLTEAEHKIIDDLGTLWNGFSEIMGHEMSRKGDIGEVMDHIHALQHIVLAQAAARAYPDRYRLLGKSVRPHGN